ncbi:MAG: hypothetical protein EI684_21130 [Candidatus Viridilinea halotolerans]|uniref:Uncharacterized protein n=1 Tax=Candidatus Viridilinea halotolerans TaxID=2491704 RepID=A0A426TRN0_9CHLR|nr:MAG: hypothetical protein EI684_21130 [Candidatus Viridilinea halotolerans]
MDTTVMVELDAATTARARRIAQAQGTTINALIQSLIVQMDQQAAIVSALRDDAAIDALMLAAGLQTPPEIISEDLQPLTEEALDALWKTMPAGTPLSQIIDEDRTERA